MATLDALLGTLATQLRRFSTMVESLMHGGEAFERDGRALADETDRLRELRARGRLRRVDVVTLDEYVGALAAVFVRWFYETEQDASLVGFVLGKVWAATNAVFNWTARATSALEPRELDARTGLRALEQRVIDSMQERAHRLHAAVNAGGAPDVWDARAEPLWVPGTAPRVPRVSGATAHFAPSE